METRIRKPRVFLSHSKQNIAFINRINVDLIRCQIEPWQDTVEIRHGKPWLNAIFQEGIPSCDAVLVYLTESSIESPMVKKEIDAGIISQLGENGIAFLPYIEQGILREKLRPDIRALQILEWNASNYNELLPSVVAEIWRSYSERMVSTAVQQEKLRRLELELAIEKLQKDDNGAIFASSEDRDFTYIWNSLNRDTQIIFEASVDDLNDPSSPQKAKAKRVEAEIKATMNVASLVINQG